MADPLALVETRIAEIVDDKIRALSRYKKGRALVPVTELGELWGMEQDAALDLAAELEADGWLQSWDETTPPVVILSQRSGDRLGLELIPPDVEDLVVAYWYPRGTRPRRFRTSPGGGCLTETDAFRSGANAETSKGFDGLADETTPSPESVAEQADEPFPATREEYVAKYVLDKTPPAIPRPLRILGIRPPWNGPAPCPSSVCPGCGGRKLSLIEACAFEGCNRSGADRFLGPLMAWEKPEPEKKAAPKPDGLAGGRGKATGATVKIPKTKAKKQPRRGKPKPVAGGNSFSLKDLRRRLGA